VFPFTYKGKTYNGCTTADGYDPWCSYDNPYQNGRWRYCTKDEISRYGKNNNPTSTRTACVFPFTWKGITYNGCTTAGGYDPWCSYSSQYNGGSNWRYCTNAEINRAVQPKPVVQAGNSCAGEQGFCVTSTGVSPDQGMMKIANSNGNSIAYQQECLQKCKAYASAWTMAGAIGCELNWSRWGSGCYVHTRSVVRGNNAEGHMCWVLSKCQGAVVNIPTTPVVPGCVFPFTYKGVTYTECTTVDGGGKPWCAKDSVYRSGRWKYCANYYG